MYFLRCVELGISSIELLRVLSVGDIYDMIIEKANDQEKYPYKATQEDIDHFFG